MKDHIPVCIVISNSIQRRECIKVHKPALDKFKVGDKWECPTCNQKYLRVDETRNISIGKKKLHFSWVTV